MADSEFVRNHVPELGTGKPAAGQFQMEMSESAFGDPRISVVITSFNQKDYLVEAIESVVHQTYTPHEIIIADDHSTDGSVSIIQDYVDRYAGWVKAVFQKENVGIPKNRNAALHRVTGTHVAILDGDDRYLPNNLEMQVNALSGNPRADCVFSNLYFIDERGVRNRIRDSDLQPSGDVFSWIAAGKMGLLRSFLCRYDSVKRVGFMDDGFPKFDGYILTLRLARYSQFVYEIEPLAEYREYDWSDSNSFSNLQHLHYLEDVYAEVLRLTKQLQPHEILRVKRAWAWILTRQRISANIESGKMLRALGWLVFGVLRRARELPMLMRRILR